MMKLAYKLIYFLFLIAPFLLPRITEASVSTGIIQPGFLSNGLVAWWTLDGKDTVWTSSTAGTVIDKSGNGATGTLTNMNVANSPIQGKIGQGFFFSGISNRYISIVPTSSINLTGALSVSVWVKESDLASVQTIFVRGAANGVASSERYFLRSSAGKFLFEVSNGTSILTTSSSNPPATIGTVGPWYHLVAEYNGTDTVTLYVNGASNGNTATSGGFGNLNATPSAAAGIGSDNSIRPFKGAIDDVRVYNRALSQAEITQLYLAGSVVNSVSTSQDSLANGLTGWWTLDGKDTPWTSATAATTLDKSGNGNTGTLTNMKLASATVQGKIGQGLSFFEPQSNFVNTSKSLSTFVSAATSTVSAWIYLPVAPSSLGGNGCTNADVHAIFEDNSQKLFLGVDATNFCAGLTDSGGVKKVTTAYVVNKWTHLVGVHANGTLFFYMNGALVGSTAAGDVSLLTGTVNLGRSFNSGGFFNGYADDVRVYNRALSQAEVTQLYLQGSQTVAITNPNPINNNGGLIGYWNFDGKNMNWATGKATDTSGSGNDGLLVSLSTTTAAINGKIGQGLLFNGINSNVNIGNVSAYNFGATQNFTASFWIKKSTTATNTVFGKKNSTGVAAGWLVEVSNNLVNLVISDGTTQITVGKTTTSITNNKWHLVTVVVDRAGANTATVYYDGVQASTAASLSTIAGSLTNANNTKIGSTDSGAEFTNGVVDDVRLYSRILSQAEITQLYNTGK